jgi:hypothetical protein
VVRLLNFRSFVNSFRDCDPVFEYALGQCFPATVPRKIRIRLNVVRVSAMNRGINTYNF